MRNLILSDVDDVLLDWATPFKEYMANDSHFPKNPLGEDLVHIYELDDEYMLSRIEHFNDSVTFANLKPVEGALDILPMLAQHGVKLHAISSCGDSARMEQTRMKNLYQVFGEDIFDKVTVIPLGESKKKNLMPYKNSGLFWIEDNLHHAEVGEKLGLKSVFMCKPWNQTKASRFAGRKINNWYDFYCYYRMETPV